MKNKNQKLYLAQFVATIFVVMIHSGTVIGNPIAHFILKNMICRSAGPFFFINNAYFFHLSASKNGEDISLNGEMFRSVLGFLPQDFSYYADFIGLKFMLYIAALKGLRGKLAK